MALIFLLLSAYCFVFFQDSYLTNFFITFYLRLGEVKVRCKESLLAVFHGEQGAWILTSFIFDNLEILDIWKTSQTFWAILDIRTPRPPWTSSTF